MDGRERLIEIMQSHGLNAKQLSERINVSAGTISNIMGGRNKPSLEFWQNVAQAFPYLNHSWLFMGVGEIYQEGYTPQLEPSTPVERDLFSQLNTEAPPTKSMLQSVSAAKLQPSEPATHVARKVEKIMIFYSDGTFEER